MDKVEESLKNLRAIRDEHFVIAKEIINAKNGNILPMDVFTFSVLNRSICLLSAFCDLIEKKNFVAAAPMIRLQLDNLLRFRAAWLVDDINLFVSNVIKGEKISSMKDKNGKKMSDFYLVEDISKENPSLKKIYENVSGYIHLSEKHIFNSMGKLEGEGVVNFKIGEVDEFISDTVYLEAIHAFFEITGNLFRYLKGWSITKGGEGIKKESVV